MSRPNLLQAMARVAILLERARGILDAPRGAPMVCKWLSKKDLEAIQRVAAELIAERSRSAPFRAAEAGPWKGVDAVNRIPNGQTCADEEAAR